MSGDDTNPFDNVPDSPVLETVDLDEQVEKVNLAVSSESEVEVADPTVFEKRASKVNIPNDHEPNCEVEVTSTPPSPKDSSATQPRESCIMSVEDEPQTEAPQKAKDLAGRGHLAAMVPQDDAPKAQPKQTAKEQMASFIATNPFLIPETKLEVETLDTPKESETTDAAGYDVFEIMRKGSPIMKHGNFYDQFDFRMFRLTDDHDAILWTKKSTMQVLRIPVRKLHEIVEAQQSKTFKKSPKPEVEDLSFSIRYRYNKDGKTFVTTLDLICIRKFDQQVWINGLRALMENPLQKELAFTEEKNEADASGAPLMKRSAAKTGTRYGVGVALTATGLGIVGIPVLAYATWTHSRDPTKTAKRRLVKVKEVMAKIGKLMVRLEVNNHPYIEHAKEKYLYIGTRYEQAMNINKESQENINMRIANAAQCHAESQALYLYLKIESDRMKKEQKAGKSRNA